MALQTRSRKMFAAKKAAKCSPATGTKRNKESKQDLTPLKRKSSNSSHYSQTSIHSFLSARPPEVGEDDDKTQELEQAAQEAGEDDDKTQELEQAAQAPLPKRRAGRKAKAAGQGRKAKAAGDNDAEDEEV
eukprot:g41937.t1